LSSTPQAALAASGHTCSDHPTTPPRRTTTRAARPALTHRAPLGPPAAPPATRPSLIRLAGSWSPIGPGV